MARSKRGVRRKKRKLTARKAKTILKEGKAKGRKLTAKQKRFFGAVASGQRIRRK